MKLTGISAPPAPLLAGDVIQFAITATNQSGNDTGPVSLRLDATDEATGELQPTVTTAMGPIGANGSSTATVGWDTDGLLPGVYTIQVSATADGDTDNTNNAISRSVELVNALDLVSVSPKTVTAIVGNPIRFAVQVRNLGNDEVEDVTVGLFENHGTEAVANAVIGAIAVGTTASTTLIWDTAGQEVDNRSLAVFVSASGQGSDANDSQWVTVHLRNPITLTATADAMTSHVAGAPVTVAATVANAGSNAVNGVVVSLYAGDPAAAIDTATIGTLAAGGTATADLVWNTAGVSAGDHTLQVVAAAPDYAEDIDDRADVVVTLEEPVVDVAFAGAMTAPAAIVIGKAVTVSANLSNLGNTPASTSVGLYIDNAAEPVAMSNVVGIEPGATQAVNVVWAPVGPVFLVGQRELRLTAEVAEDANPANNAVKSPVTIHHSAFDNPDAPEECVGDVGVDTAIYQAGGPLADPPNYRPDESLYVGYQIYNYSCAADVVVNVDLTTVLAGVSIVGGTDACRAGCLVPAGGRVEREVLWPLAGVPYTVGETVQAAIAVSSPEGFADADAGNDTATASLHINIVRVDDIMLGLGTAEGSKGHLKDELNRPEFGFVDLALHSADLQPATLSHSDATFSVSVEASNGGSEIEPAAIDVARVASDGSQRQVLHTETIMVKPGDERQKSSFEVPADELVVGAQNVQVALLAVNNKATSANAKRFEVNRLAPTVTADVELVSMVSTPPVAAMQGQWVEIQVAVRNNGSTAVNVPILLTFPSEEKSPERKSPRILPGETAVASFTWKTRNYEPGLHVLRAEILLENNLTPGDTSAELQFLLEPRTITATILEVSTVPEAPVVGEAVSITILVRNDGPISANIPVTLHFPSADKQPETRRPRIAPGATAAANFTWRTGNYLPGIHDFRVEFPATSPSDQRFAVELLPAPISVSIVGINTDPAESAPRGEWVEVYVTVRNDGPTPVNVPVQLTFPSEEKRPERKSPRILPGETAVASFTWKTRNYEPGVHVLRAELLLENNLAPGDTSAELQFRIDPPVTSATILEISTVPEAPVVGELVSITVLVRNDSPISANIPVTLHFPSADKQPETRSPWIAPGATATANFTWRTGNYLPGRHDFRVEVSATSPSDQRFAVELLPAPVNVSIVGIGTNPAESAVRGDWVEIWVAVRNDGPVATRVPVELTFPSSDKKPERKSLRIAPGQTARVAFTWKTANYDVGPHILVATLLSEANVAEGDTSAQLRFRLTARRFTVELPPPAVDFAVVDIYPPSVAHPVVKGDWVEVAALVRNLGPGEGRSAIQLYNETERKVMYKKNLSLEPGESRVVEFTWKTLRYTEGENEIFVRSNAAYDENRDNDRSPTAIVNILTNRDITVGFGVGDLPGATADATSVPTLRTTAAYLDEILVLGSGATPAGRVTLIPPSARVGTQPQRVDDAGNPAAIHRLRQSAQTSATDCVRLQSLLGQNQPRGVLCPKAPALIR